MNHPQCQVCGRSIKLRRDGMIPKHKAWPLLGQQQGQVCLGSEHAPEPAMDVVLPLYVVAVKEGNDKEATLYGARVGLILGLAHELAVLAEFFRRLGTVFWYVKAWEKYGHCRYCGKPVDDATYARAVRHCYPEVCSDDCRRKDYIKKNACCEKATVRPCVCTHSFDCPDHGTMHVGTHD